MRRLCMLALVLVGCGDEPRVDAGADAQIDAGVDASVDAGPDLRLDASTYDLVDPFIGTANTSYWSPNCYPGAVLPFGMISASPDTTQPTGVPWFNHAAGYHWGDDLMLGFSHNRHQGTSTPDLGVVLLMPAVGSAEAVAAARTARFEHTDETAEPGYYAVRLADPAVFAEITVTTRAAHHRYAFDASTDRRVVLDLGHALAETEVTDAQLTVGADGALEGWVETTGRFSDDTPAGVLRTSFAARVSPPPSEMITFDGSTLGADPARRGPSIGAVLTFDAPVVEVQIAISYVDVDAARNNLDAELPTWDFEAARAAARDAWERELSVVAFDGGSGAEREIMATALYHAFVVPSIVEDSDGRYRGLDGAVHSADDFTYHSFFSLWDTYRTVHPLFALVLPDRQRDMARSLMRMGNDGGFLPRWPFAYATTGSTVGASADIVLAESALKGIDIDSAAALEIILRSAETPLPAGSAASGREGIDDYVTLGYVPADATGRSVSRSLEYAVADAAIARLAEMVGQPDVALRFEPRGRSYENLFDASLAVFRGRNRDGSWVSPFDVEAPEEADVFYGGNALHYSFMAPHDPAGLAELYGAEELEASLTRFFEGGREEVEDPGPLADFIPNTFYDHGNEPDMHAAYLFLAVGRPDLAQEWSAWVAGAYYTDGPDGIRGNEDAGTISAWYVWNALGLYPVPGRALYLLGRPTFERAELSVRGGTLVIEAVGSGPYVQDVSLDGASLTRPWVRHDEIADGATLRFVLGDAASAWGVSFGDP